MQVTATRHRWTHRIKGEEGFTMLVVIGVLLVSSLLLAAAFVAAEGDISLSHRTSTARQAYYAALAGIQRYEYELEINPDYWEGCEAPSGTVAKEPAESYVDRPLLASDAESKYKISKCEATKPFESMIEKSGAAANTFRVEATGTVTATGTERPSTDSIVATFKVTGFLNYVYFTEYEDEDPTLYDGPTQCESSFYAERVKEKVSCKLIVFTTGDEVNGPMRTDDTPVICGKPSFGRAGHSPSDTVEFYSEAYESGCTEKAAPVYNTASGKPILNKTRITVPTSDTTLTRYVEEEDEFTGVTHLALEGASSTIEVTSSSGTKKTIPWPSNGLIFVRANPEKSCGYKYKPLESDEKTEEAEQTNCGEVYVSGTYSKSLTIGAEDNLIIDGSIYPVTTSGTPATVTGALGGEPTGTATLGLIANEFVRIYHPIAEENCEEVTRTERVFNKTTNKYENKEVKETICKKPGPGEERQNGSSSLESPWIYAGILSTRNSFVVDNYEYGKALGKLNVYGAIAQKYRGIVGIVGGSGYIKNYLYDERLAVDEPPYFLSPLNSGWKIVRETATQAG